MKKYIRCHLVEATPMTRGAYNKKRGWTVPKDENPKDRGYIVKYPDGYVSWCPKAQFEAAGRPIDGMTLSTTDLCLPSARSKNSPTQSSSRTMSRSVPTSKRSLATVAG